MSGTLNLLFLYILNCTVVSEQTLGWFPYRLKNFMIVKDISFAAILHFLPLFCTVSLQLSAWESSPVAQQWGTLSRQNQITPCHLQLLLKCPWPLLTQQLYLKKLRQRLDLATPLFPQWTRSSPVNSLRGVYREALGGGLTSPQVYMQRLCFQCVQWHRYP